MSFFYNCCAQNTEDDEFMNQAIITEKKISGKDRILRLSQQEQFSEYTKYFQSEEEKKIFENDIPSNNDIFNLNRNNQLYNIKNSKLCVFCGGEKCKYEDSSLYKNCSIKGLKSDLFYDCIYASQRPSTILIKKYDLINVFKKNNIKLIVNCEIHGEHPNCGPNKGLELDSGYSYSPSLFIAENIDVFNCGFEEMTSPSTFDFMIDIVKKISYVIKYKNGKVLVHCHSGNGRTCLVIVCFLIYYFNKTAEEAINEIRKKREKAINNDAQEEYCRKFEIYVNILKTVFTEKQISINNHIKYQMDLDYNFSNNINIPSIISLFFNNSQNISKDIINCKYIPKILLICINKIIEIKNKNRITNNELYQILNGMNKISQEEIKELGKIKNEINKNNWEILIQNENSLILTELLFSWMNECVIECINPKKIERFWNKCSQILNVDNHNHNNSNTEDKNIFDEFMKGNYPMNKKKIKHFIQLFQIIFSKTEIEIIKYISIFLTLIYPIITIEHNTSADIVQEYKRFVIKLSLFLLGYNLDKVNAFSNNKNLREMNDAKKFILILEFFIFYSYKDEKNKNQFSYNNNDWISKYLQLKSEYENNDNIIKDDDIMLFLNKKPKNEIMSVKYFFIAENN